MDIGEVLKHISIRALKTAELDKAEFEAIVGEKDRENLSLIAREIKSKAGLKELGAEMLIVGGLINHPERMIHKDLDVKISVKNGHSAVPVIQAIDDATQALSQNGSFQVEQTKERSPMVEDGYVTTYNLYPKNGGSVIEIIPPYGSEDLPLDLEKTVGRSAKRRFYVFDRI